jgi:hypothetical protein
VFTSHVVPALCDLAERCTSEYPFVAFGAAGSIGEIGCPTGELIEENLRTGEQVWQRLVEITSDLLLVEPFLCANGCCVAHG